MVSGETEVTFSVISVRQEGKAFSTINVYLVAISSCHIGLYSDTVGKHPIVSRFMKGVRRLRPVTIPVLPAWDLSLVLEALQEALFEPLEQADLKIVSYKTALLLTLTTMKRVGELHALSINPACIRFTQNFSRVILWPNPAFVPKVIKPGYSRMEIDI